MADIARLTDHKMGPSLGHWERTLGMNVGTAVLIVFFFVPGGLAFAATDSRLLTVLGGVALAGALLATTVVLQQVGPNLDVRWSLYRDGFSRTRWGREVAATWDDIDALYARPSNQGSIHLRSGQTLRVDGLGLGPMMGLLDEAAAKVALPRLRATLATAGHVEAGPLRISPDALEVEGVTFPLGDAVFRRSLQEIKRGRARQTVWLFRSNDPPREVSVWVEKIPFPAATLEPLLHRKGQRSRGGGGA